MQRIRKLGLASAFACASLLAGCLNGDGDSMTAPTAEDREDESALNENMDLGVPGYADPDVFVYGNDADSGARADFDTADWWRELVTVDKSVHIEFSKPSEGPRTASVQVTKELGGVLHLSDGLEPPTIAKKSFEDVAVRSLYFERQGPPITHPRRGWKLKAISGASIASPGATREIHSVRVQADGIDETITNVTDLVRIHDLLTLPANSEVHVTVETGDATDAVFLHLKRNEVRMELASVGEGKFTGSFVTSKRDGPHHVVVDVLSHGSLFDDTAAYDNVAWGVPYLIAGTEDDCGDDHGGDDEGDDD